MPTTADLEKQERFERRQIKGGLERIQHNTKKLLEKDYASATVFGSASIETLLPYLIEFIDEKKKARKKVSVGGAGHLMQLLPYIFDIDTESQAAITAKLTFDKIFSPRKENSKVVNVVQAIGSALEAESQMRYYETSAPGLFETLKANYWHQAKGTEYKRKSMQTLMSKHDIDQWKPWNRVEKIKVGTWFLDCLLASSGWFERSVFMHRNKKQQFLVPTEKFLKNKEEIIRLAELFSQLAWPMLIEPRDWSPMHEGGYYLNDLTRCHDMVRRGVPLCVQGEIPYSFLNKIQKVKYRLNPFIVEIAKVLEEREIEVGKFRPVINHPEPPKPSNMDDEEARKEWRKEKAIACNKNANEWRISCRTRMTMNCVREFEGKEYYVPWSFDYRGRAYPIPSFLTPQDTDFGKSLIKFAEEAPITEDGVKWLAFQVATTYGLDKATLGDRLEWVTKPENIQLITRVATAPIENIGDWEAADEPFQFAAACEEYYSVVLAKTRTTTGLPVATDATCSGLQILAGLARDKSTACLVNVVPSDKPQDAYQVIADTSRENIPERLRPYWDRKKTKRCVMTIPYNAKPFSNRQYIRDAFNDIDVEVDKDELTQIVQAVRDAMELVVPGPMKVMRWIESEVSKAIKRGSQELTWVTPSGFRVTQRLMKMAHKIVELKLLGRCRVKVLDGEKGVDLRHHKNATAPNLIHSLDASLLHLSVDKFDAPISLIHDSVLCRATDMSHLSTLVRDTYMHLFAEHDFLKDFAQAIGAESEPPIIGDLEPSTVIESTYFFC
ncbi:MAG: T7 RNA polymerase [Gammaproteobacteria bacterium]|nr:T7 RNA polymerase [Gammaproteobacteria bacterium]